MSLRRPALQTFLLQLSPVVLWSVSMKTLVLDTIASYHNRFPKVYIDAACLTWNQLFTSWFNAIKTEPWLENHDIILQQLFQWLLPPLLACISTCRYFFSFSLYIFSFSGWLLQFPPSTWSKEALTCSKCCCRRLSQT